MVELLIIHWDFIRRPTESLSRYIPNWPVKLGLAVYAFAMLSYFGDAETVRTQYDLMTGVFGGASMAGYYAYNLLVAALNIAICWYLMPLIVRRLSPLPRDNFDANLYRKLVFFSPTALVIITIVFSLPVKIIVTALAWGGIEGLAGVIVLLLIEMLVGGAVALWGMVAIVMWIVIHWKGLRQYFKLSVWQIILVQFVIPFLLFSPLWLLYLPRIVSYFRNYMTVGG